MLEEKVEGRPRPRPINYTFSHSFLINTTTLSSPFS